MIKLFSRHTLLTLILLTIPLNITIPFHRTHDLNIIISRVSKEPPDHDRNTGGSKSFYSEKMRKT